MHKYLQVILEIPNTDGKTMICYYNFRLHEWQQTFGPECVSSSVRRDRDTFVYDRPHGNKGYVPMSNWLSMHEVKFPIT